MGVFRVPDPQNEQNKMGVLSYCGVICYVTTVT